MKRLVLALVAAMAAGSLSAQQTIVSTRISTSPEGARFYVDGQLYESATTFSWPVGSRHVLEFPLTEGTGCNGFQGSVDLNYRYFFGGWQDSRSLLIPTCDNVQVITANANLTSLTAMLERHFRINFQILGNPQLNTELEPVLCGGAAGGGSAPGEPGSQFLAGIAWIEPNCYINGNQRIWLTENEYRLNAFPFPGYVFTGWSYSGRPPVPYLLNLRIAGPITLAAHFERGKRVKFLTDPPGLKVSIDRTETPTSSVDRTIDNPTGPQPGADACEPDFRRLPVNAPPGLSPLCYGEFDFIPGSSHLVGAPSPQVDRNGRADWVFDGFSNGLGQNATFVADWDISTPTVVTARFVRGIRSTIRTEPAGLKLTINGRDNWPGNNFVWAPNSKQMVAAPEIAVDSQGRRWTFVSWSNGGARTQEITVPNSPDAVFDLSARFELLGQVTVKTNPPGLRLVVDGADCTAPCVIDRRAGTEVSFMAPMRQSVSEDQRHEFVSWSDSSTATQSYRFTDGVAEFVATYRTAFRLITIGDPEEGVTFQLDPPSQDRFYPLNQEVTVTAEARQGWKFRRFTGDIQSTSPTGVVRMSLARVVVAGMDKVPFIPPAVTRNAVGETPEKAVAPGSIISIFGEDLAPRLEPGRSNPLQQSIAGTAVEVEGRWLPLLYVSQEQINAQLSSDLADGDYKLRIQRQGLADVTGEFKVARNAPGLYSSQMPDGRQILLALREDGSQITPQRPARRGELIRIYANGLGPYTRRAIDGFQVTDAQQYVVADKVEVLVADAVVEPVFAGAAEGLVGTQTILLRLPASLPAGAIAPIIVRVNGKFSNPGILPLQP